MEEKLILDSSSGAVSTSIVGEPEPDKFVPQTPCDPFFGPFMAELRNNLVAGGSELGTGLTLFTLAVATRSRSILEIGRYTGFSTFALASALRFMEMGWDEDQFVHQRPDMDYPKFETREPGHLTSLDVYPKPIVQELLKRHDLEKYVTLVNENSQTYVLDEAARFDLMFIDGDHTFGGCLSDVVRYVPKYLRPGGYFILHDYFGWFNNGKNCSPIMQVVQKCLGDFDQVLIDTGYQSLVVLRKQHLQLPIPARVNQTAGEAAGAIELYTR
jgi:hypothetical protein